MSEETPTPPPGDVPPAPVKQVETDELLGTKRGKKSFWQRIGALLAIVVLGLATLAFGFIVVALFKAYGVGGVLAFMIGPTRPFNALALPALALSATSLKKSNINKVFFSASAATPATSASSSNSMRGCTL